MMLVVGLTGSIGMGKSTVAERIRSHGIPVCDADQIVHDLYAAGGIAVPMVEMAFPGTTGPDGVDRAKLTEALGGDAAAFKKLEGIVHPLVFEAEKDFLVRAKKKDKAELAVLEIPLLLEGGRADLFDVIVVVSAGPDVQRERVLAREGMTVEKFEAMVARQMPDAEKRAKADIVVDTGKPLEATLDDVDAMIDSLKGRSGAAFRKWVDASPQ